MSQEYPEIPITEIMYDSLAKILERDNTSLTLGAGTSFPQELEDWMVGRVCLRTDLKTLYMLESVNPVSWKEMINFSEELATKAYVEKNYQPLNSNLTALSSAVGGSDQIPYFTTKDTMSTISLTNYLAKWLSVSDADAARSLLGLGALAQKDTVGTSDIKDKAITTAKLNYTPITAGEGYTTGDIKESYNSATEDGFITLPSSGTATIGDSSSGATYKGDTYSNLFVKLWASSACSVLTSSGGSSSKGSTATNDWSGHKRLTLPVGLSYLNPSCYYKIKI